jgi:hypothetical protein
MRFCANAGADTASAMAAASAYFRRDIRRSISQQRQGR